MAVLGAAPCCCSRSCGLFFISVDVTLGHPCSHSGVVFLVGVPVYFSCWRLLGGLVVDCMVLRRGNDRCMTSLILYEPL